MEIKLLDHKELKTFPSGSGIEFFDDKVYLVGDDATNIIVKSKKWKMEKKIHLFDSPSERIPKLIKSDLEATTIVFEGKTPKLLMLGSGSRLAYRNKAILLDLNTSSTEEFDLEIFYNRLKEHGVYDLNIEGAAAIDDNVLLCNRGNKSNPSNCIILTSNGFWKNQAAAEILILRLEIEQPEGQFIGVSGLTYSEKNDWLLFTTSTEHTYNAIDDGEIGDSYLGIIENVTRKIGRKKMKINELINLPKADKIFKGHKIESLCIQRDKESNLKLHLISDNDLGHTALFKIRLKA
jgi:hypothetical protein